jgi:hypothetical protein
MRYLLLSIMLLSTFAAGASRRHSKPVKHDSRLFIPTPEAQAAQNEVIDRLGLMRIQNDQQLTSLELSGTLVPLHPEYGTLTVSPRLPARRRACLYTTSMLLLDVSRAYFKAFRTTLTVTSAVRTTRDQKQLLRWNRNAAPASGPMASSHLTGAAVDIARRGMTGVQTRFMEQTLLEEALLGRVIVLEENGQMCFHIFFIPEEPWLITYLNTGSTVKKP